MKEIFTGYAWRPMTPEEIEIMDATRVRLSIFGEPDAGDIYEGVDAVTETFLNLNGIKMVPGGILIAHKSVLQEPCEYCGDKKELIDFNEDDWRFGGSPEIKIIENRLNVNYDAYSGDSSFEREYEINYCPMCGKKLSDK